MALRTSGLQAWFSLSLAVPRELLSHTVMQPKTNNLWLFVFDSGERDVQGESRVVNILVKHVARGAFLTFAGPQFFNSDAHYFRDIISNERIDEGKGNWFI